LLWSTGSGLLGGPSQDRRGLPGDGERGYEQLGRIEARTGLRMIPTSPRSPLRFRTAGFPSVRLQSWPIRQGLPMIMQRLSVLPACPSRDQVCLHPSCPPRQHGIPALCRRPPARWSTAMRATYIALLQGPSLRSRFCCPGPSTLNRPHPPHSQAHHNFAVRRLICDAFAVRERLGDPRVVPRFTCSILPSMSSSTSPGSRSLHPSSSFARRTCLRRFGYGSAPPTLANFGAY
jgi:hypothetical protein